MIDIAVKCMKLDRVCHKHFITTRLNLTLSLNSSSNWLILTFALNTLLTVMLGKQRLFLGLLLSVFSSYSPVNEKIMMGRVYLQCVDLDFHSLSQFPTHKIHIVLHKIRCDEMSGWVAKKCEFGLFHS